jgi:hypothetical protein
MAGHVAASSDKAHSLVRYLPVQGNRWEEISDPRSASFLGVWSHAGTSGLKSGATPILELAGHDEAVVVATSVRQRRFRQKAFLLCRARTRAPR